MSIVLQDGFIGVKQVMEDGRQRSVVRLSQHAPAVSTLCPLSTFVTTVPSPVRRRLRLDPLSVGGSTSRRSAAREWLQDVGLQHRVAAVCRSSRASLSIPGRLVLALTPLLIVSRLLPLSSTPPCQC